MLAHACMWNAEQTSVVSWASEKCVLAFQGKASTHNMNCIHTNHINLRLREHTYAQCSGWSTSVWRCAINDCTGFVFVCSWSTWIRTILSCWIACLLKAWWLTSCCSHQRRHGSGRHLCPGRWGFQMIHYTVVVWDISQLEMVDSLIIVLS